VKTFRRFEVFEVPREMVTPNKENEP